MKRTNPSVSAAERPTIKENMTKPARQKGKYGIRKAALQAGQVHYLTGLMCKNGHTASRQTTNGKCTMCEKTWAQENKEYCRAQVKKSEQKNLGKKRARINAWAKDNPHKKNANEARRRAALMNRTPAWLTVDEHWVIEEAYELAALRTKIFGFLWHVDHAIPLRGRRVSGLHVPTNLQVVPATVNLQKYNRFEIV